MYACMCVCVCVCVCLYVCMYVCTYVYQYVTGFAKQILSAHPIHSLCRQAIGMQI